MPELLDASAEANAQTPRTNAAGRLLAVLDAFGPRNRALSLSEISRRSGLSLSTAHRLVHELVSWGALERDPNGCYSIGVRLLELAALAPRGLDLREAAFPCLDELHHRTRGNVHLAVRDGMQVVYVEVIRACATHPTSGKAGDRCDRLSGGQLRRLDMALALIGDPELVFLDEPTTGFDPSARHAAWEVIAGLRDLGKTIFLTTHYMEEAETLADQIVIIAAGRAVASGTPATIGGRATDATTVTFSLPDGLTSADLPALPAPVTEGRGRTVEIVHHEPVPVLHALTTWALEHGYPLTDITAHRPTLEEIYLRLTEEHQ